jgi:glycosyltransferase involved in cell wall biosynthesis
MKYLGDIVECSKEWTWLMRSHCNTISVIIPVFGNKVDLLKTISSLSSSILSETEVGLQLIIIDGTDFAVSSLEEVEAIRAVSIEDIVYIHESDEGPYDAMNKGIALATGYWMWFLNSGDEAIELPTYTGIGTTKSLIIGRWMGTSGNIVIPSKERGLGSGSRSEIGCGLCHQAMLFNRKRFGNKLYDYGKYSLAAELDYFYSAITAEDYFLDELFMVKYDNKRGLSKSKAVAHLKQSLAIYSENKFRISKKRLLRRYFSAQWNQWQARIRR